MSHGTQVIYPNIITFKEGHERAKILVCLVVRKTISEEERTILTTLHLADAKNIDGWLGGKGELQRALPLDVPIVPSSTIAIVANGERLTCAGFSVGKTVRLGSFAFIANYFGDLSLSPRRGDAGTTFMGSTCSRASISRQVSRPKILIFGM
jgi:hypothetical protein